eukprot:TRINITY_DN16953_c0_g1_i1.p1 TRINITY_DN16953_c0_g1~~TRINITY_DN16953_c0_g1_i1.p1  ORF type:complete len:276 (-),score=55.61 TRINITY_DN16953_c0_g1_i1:176-1003(-)
MAYRPELLFAILALSLAGFTSSSSSSGTCAEDQQVDDVTLMEALSTDGDFEEDDDGSLRMLQVASRKSKVSVSTEPLTVPSVSEASKPETTVSAEIKQTANSEILGAESGSKASQEKHGMWSMLQGAGTGGAAILTHAAEQVKLHNHWAGVVLVFVSAILFGYLMEFMLAEWSRLSNNAGSVDSVPSRLFSDKTFNSSMDFDDDAAEKSESQFQSLSFKGNEESSFLPEKLVPTGMGNSFASGFKSMFGTASQETRPATTGIAAGLASRNDILIN